MRRLAGPLLIALACAPTPVGETDGGSTSTAGDDSEAASAPTTMVTTGDAPIAGCDVVLRGDIDDTAAVQAALDGAADGSTICFEGYFALGPLRVADKVGLTLIDAHASARSMDLPLPRAVLDFQSAAAGAGLSFERTPGLTLSLLEIRDIHGAAVKVVESEDVTLYRLTVLQGTSTSPHRGPLGLHVDRSQRVAIVGCNTGFATDTGILVTDSQDVALRGIQAVGSGTGVQIRHAERVELDKIDPRLNALGILVVGSREVLLHDSAVEMGTHENFAPTGTLSAALPAGIGVMVVASDAVELRDNTFADNPTAGVVVVSSATLAALNLLAEAPDPADDGYPETVDIHDNALTDNGREPAALFRDVFMLDPMAQLAWDGVVDANKDNGDGRLNLCIRGNGDADFVDFDGPGLGAGKSFDLGPHDCEHPPVSPVELP